MTNKNKPLLGQLNDKSYLNFTPDLTREFICPDLTEDKYPYVELLYCESICLNRGCPKIKTCEAYKKAKELSLKS